MTVPSAEASPAQRVVGVAVVVLCAVFVVARTTAAMPWTDDISVWIFVHEWLVRGAPLYDGVWDHKDWGFFAITSPFYGAGGITGLYVSGLLATVTLGAGVFLSARQVVTWRPAVVLAALATATYAAAPSFLATYTENYAIALAVLAVGLMFRFPVIAGAVFAMSTAVKITGVLVVLSVVLVDVVMRARVGRSASAHRDVRHSAALRVGAGFAATLAVIVAVAGLQGALPGWRDIFDYNTQYGAIRRESVPGVASLRDVAGFLRYVTPDAHTVAFVIVVVGVLIALVVLLGRRTWPRPLVVNAALLAGAAVVVALQFPLSFPHYQMYFLGAAVSWGAVLVAVIWQGRPQRTRVALRTTAMIAVAPLACGALLTFSAGGAGTLATGLTRWGQLSDAGDRVVGLDHIPSNSSLAFVNAGGRLIAPASLPAQATLACRFFYHFPHLLPRYGDEMLDCLKDRADFVIVRHDTLHDAAFDARVNQQLLAHYARCDTGDRVFELWARTAAACPTT